MINSKENGTGSARSEKNGNQWEREVIEKLAFAAITEQRRARRWGIFFKSLLFIYFIVVFVVAITPLSEKSLHADAKHTAVVDVSGLIAAGTQTNAEIIIKGLQSAFKDENTKGIILRMNSPGGSPVQSAYVYNEIRKMKKAKPGLPIYAVVTDICASGGYYIASAADKIFVNQSSIIGSIGVVMNGFGFVTAMERLGIERRLLTAGENKAILDPFSPMNSEEKDHVQQMLNQVHRQFIKDVQQGRGNRLKNNPALFTGQLWIGVEGIELGLADGIGSTHSVAKEIIGAEEIVNFTPQEKLFDRLVNQLGVVVGRTLMEIVSVRFNLSN